MMLGARLTGHIIPEIDVFVGVLKQYRVETKVENTHVKSNATSEHLFETVVHNKKRWRPHGIK